MAKIVAIIINVRKPFGRDFKPILSEPATGFFFFSFTNKSGIRARNPIIPAERIIVSKLSPK